MGFKDTYQYEEYSQFFDCPDGDLPVKILSAKETTAKSGSRMLEVNLLVDGAANSTPYVERYVEGEYFNRNMSRFFDAFGIPRGDFNYPAWVNKRAVGHFEHKQESYQASSGEWKNVNRAVLKYLLVSGAETQQAGQEANAQNPAQIQLKKLLQMTYPSGQPLFTQNEIAGYRQNYSNGQPLSQVLDFVKAEADKRLATVSAQDNAGASAAFNGSQDDFIF